jgi:hypothetical protein
MFIVTLAIGCIVVGAIAASPLLADSVRPYSSFRLSAAAISVALALPLFCATFPAAAARRSELFLCSLILILVAAILLPRGGDEPDEPGPAADDDPPWWPEFERAFRSYARRDRRPPLPTR